MSGRNSASVSCPRSSLAFCGVGSACVLVIRDDEMGAAYILSSCLIARRAVSSELAEEDTGGVGGRLNDVAFDRMPYTIMSVVVDPVFVRIVLLTLTRRPTGH